MPRLIRLGDFRLEAYLDGNLLVFTHNDVPGIIGAVGTIFGNHRVNIAQMSVGRAAPGGGAIGVLNLDAVPPPAPSPKSPPTPTSKRPRHRTSRRRPAADLAPR